MAIDFTTPAGRVRLLISDTDESAFVFSDGEIEAFLALEGGNVLRAAAQALDTMASNEAMVSKVIRTRDGLSTNGAQVAAELRARAASLRAQADDVTDDGEQGGFWLVDFDPTSWWCSHELAE